MFPERLSEINAVLRHYGISLWPGRFKKRVL